MWAALRWQSSPAAASEMLLVRCDRLPDNRLVPLRTVHAAVGYPLAAIDDWRRR
jgi:hypothetical protein